MVLGVVAIATEENKQNLYTDKENKWGEAAKVQSLQELIVNGTSCHCSGKFLPSCGCWKVKSRWWH